jgi:hypothetical protein
MKKVMQYKTFMITSELDVFLKIMLGGDGG